MQHLPHLFPLLHLRKHLHRQPHHKRLR
ncbi:hypothetical protein BCEP4_2750002 [Burkholderia cepacia]|nr:hypothetical protein BCEP4_2750002 [Burkholderia cepacia]